MTDASFFLERYAAELPHRIHSRDTNEDGGPEWHRSFESWLTDGDGKWQTGLYDETEHCQHPTNERPCPACGDSGLRVRIRHTYRHPMKRALSALATIPVPKGRPRLHTTLIVLAENDGNLGLTIAALAPEYSYCWQPTKARRWITHALYELRRCYREDAPARVLKSESQSIAEAA